ncbi:hypothetical protein [Bizionia paragorgiae]|uniref:hypothetical protein n=1 Tax=Bizionia paragorgiae TaxID=283786 RepID=UPI003A902D7A
MDIFVFIIVIVLGYSIQKSFSKSLSMFDKKNLKNLWLYHLLFGVIYWGYIVYGPGGDSFGYFKVSEELSFEEAFSLLRVNGAGTYGMYLLNVFPAKFMGFFGLTMVYTLIGYIGVMCFYLVFITNIRFNSTIGSIKLFPLIFFLPNLHFWSAGLGKDTVLFFCIALFVYGMQKPSKNLIKIVLALGLSYLIRPHITIFLIASFGMGYVLDGNLKAYQKLLFGGAFLVAFFLLFDNIMSFLKIEELDVESIDQFSESRVSNLSREHTGSAVDINGYPFPLKVFTFLYRPLFFDINGVLAVVASFENLLLLILSWKFIRLNPLKMFKRGNYMVKSLFIFVLIGSVTFSIILGNLGIMLRQKNMFILALLFVCLWGLSFSTQQKQQKLNVR